MLRNFRKHSKAMMHMSAMYSPKLCHANPRGWLRYTGIVTLYILLTNTTFAYVLDNIVHSFHVS